MESNGVPDWFFTTQSCAIYFIFLTYVSDSMAIANELHKEQITVTLMDQPVHGWISIQNNYQTTIDFGFMGRTYTFEISKWAGRWNSEFCTLFHSHCPRDAATFGSIKDDGTPDMQQKHKIAAIVQGVRDIFTCLHEICNKYHRAVVGYAIWYREQPTKNMTYSKFIGLITCHCIVRNKFLNPMVTWQKIEIT